MAGNTGRMTQSAIRARGPRMILWSIYKPNYQYRVGFAITREDHRPVEKPVWIFGAAKVYAKSYNLNYLLRLGRSAI